MQDLGSNRPFYEQEGYLGRTRVAKLKGPPGFTVKPFHCGGPTIRRRTQIHSTKPEAVAPGLPLSSHLWSSALHSRSYYPWLQLQVEHEQFVAPCEQVQSCPQAPVWQAVQQQCFAIYQPLLYR